MFFYDTLLKATNSSYLHFRYTPIIRENIMHSNESAENYLEAILILSQKLPVVRSIDIANYLGFSKPSVSVAMKNLRQKNLAEVNDAGFITLTEDGKQIAETIYERHTFFSEWLIDIGVDPEIAKEDACRLEHQISKESFDAIKQYIRKQN